MSWAVRIELVRLINDEDPNEYLGDVIQKDWRSFFDDDTHGFAINQAADVFAELSTKLESRTKHLE